MSARTLGILFTLLGVFNFLLFAYDIENDRDFFTWLWLLNSLLYILAGFRYFIKHDRSQEE